MHRVVRTAGPAPLLAAAAIVLAAGGIASAAQAQTRITGRVVDEQDQTPIATAQIQVTGTTLGATTSDSGRFTLQLPADGKSLTIRRIGFLGKTVPVTQGQTEYTIALTRDVLRLEAQVVTGVATSVSTKSSANDVAVVNAEAVNSVPAPTIENSIQGLVPGALISQNNGGEPGGGMQIQIRGITSIFANASPLYVIDGVIINNLSQEPGNNAITFSTDGGVQQDPTDLGTNRIADFNPEDIESIEVLKGASASAIYGSQASAGVVIITTKRGTAGKPTWQFSQKVGHFEQAATMNIRRFPTLASAQAWFNTDGSGARVWQSPATAAGLAANNALVSSIYDGPQAYQTQLFGNKQASYETDLSVSGTQGPTQYFLSALSKFDNGSELYTGYNKQSIRSNVTQQVTSHLSASANLFYAHSTSNRGITGNDNNGISPYDVFSYTPGFMNLNHINADGSWADDPIAKGNPFANAQGISTPENVQRFTGGGNINWTAYSSEHQTLQLNALGGADISHVEDGLFAPSNLQFEQAEALPGVATAQTADAQYINYSINLIHHYTGLSWLDATTSAGFVREKRSYLNPETVSQGLLAGLDNTQTGTVQTNFYNKTAENNQSLYGQEQVLLLDSRLSLTGGVTAERTTNDGLIDKFYFYPRAAGSYRIPQFASFIDELKLRVAYGQSGTEPNYGVRYTPLQTAVDAGASGEFQGNIVGDPTISPETETEIETGFDATLFHSRAQFTFTVYQKRVSNLLLEAGVSPSRGYNTQWFNAGEFTNQGAEISLSATPVQLRNGFTAVSTISYFRNYSVVNSLGSIPNFDQFFVWITPGRSISDVVNPNVSGVQPQLGDVLPDFTMDFNQELHYGPFQANAVVQWNKGGDMMIQTDDYYAAGPQLWGDSAWAANWLNRFNNNAYNWIEGAGFVKLRSLSLSYSLPSKWIGGFAGGRFSSARLSLEGRNLMHLYERGYHGLDPEVSSGGSTNIIRNIEITPYPPSASYFFSLDVGF